VDKRASLQDAFRMADDVLRQGIQGISELITVPGLINLDFADVRTIMSEGGAALMAVGTASGEDRAKIAAEAAISSQLLDVTISGARGILFNVTGGPGLTLFEVNQAAAIIKDTAHEDVNLIFGAVLDPNMGENIRITVIATGFERATSIRPAEMQAPKARETVAAYSSTRRPAEKVERPVPTTPVLQPVQAPAPSSAQPEFTPRTLNTDELDIPTFLRNRQQPKNTHSS
jgi:cell division protein FtsZ